MEKTKITSILSGKSDFMKYAFLVACLFFSLSGRAQQHTSLSAISHTSGAPADMKQSELKKILMGETQRWKNGKRIVIALMKTNTELGKVTTSKLYDMTGDELNKYWLSLVFQGKAQAPVFFNTVSELQSFVASNPGAIGIVDKPVASNEVRSILIDGKATF